MNSFPETIEKEETLVDSKFKGYEKKLLYSTLFSKFLEKKLFKVIMGIWEKTVAVMNSAELFTKEELLIIREDIACVMGLKNKQVAMPESYNVSIALFNSKDEFSIETIKFPEIKMTDPILPELFLNKHDFIRMLPISARLVVNNFRFPLLKFVKLVLKIISLVTSMIFRVVEKQLAAKLLSKIPFDILILVILLASIKTPHKV